MSKKIFIIVVILVATIAALPLIGNMGVKSIIKDRITMLEKNGIKVKSSDNGSNYLESKIHYEFILDDPAAFQNYIATLSKAQVPAYMNAMLDDVVMAADVRYSNMLLNSDVSLDLYPIAFTKEAEERMKAEDTALYTQMIEMLKNRDFMYHMDYDIAGSTFSGYIKDINKEISFQNGKKAMIVFEAATFKGRGTLVEPEHVELQVRKADLDFSLPQDSQMKLTMANMQSSSNFSAKNSFDLNYKAKALHLFYKDSLTQLDIDGSQMQIVSNSKVTDAKLSTNVNASMKHFKMKDQNGSLELQNALFVMDAENIDEAAYETFQKMSEQAGASSQSTMLAAIGVVSKGFDLHVKKLSVEKIAIKDSGLMDGFEHQIDIAVKADDQLLQKMQMTPVALMQDITINAKLQFASAFYDYIKTQGNNLAMVDGFVKKEGDKAIFDIVMKEGKVTVNGQSL